MTRKNVRIALQTFKLWAMILPDDEFLAKRAEMLEIINFVLMKTSLLPVEEMGRRTTDLYARLKDAKRRRIALLNE